MHTKSVFLTVKKAGLSEDALASIKEELTIHKKDYFGATETSLYYEEDEETILVPRNYPIEGAFVNTTNLPALSTPITFKGELRDYQIPYINNEVIPEIKANKDIVMEMPCGHGKTICSLYLIATLYKTPTLILVPTSILMEQWASRIDEVMPGCNYAMAKPNYRITGKEDILIMSFDLMTVRTFPESFYNHFGCLVLDEAHITGAETYYTVLKKIPCRYRLALTATFRRHDNVHKILAHDFGNCVRLPPQFFTPNVYAYSTKLYFGSSLPQARLDTILTLHPHRVKSLLKIVFSAVDAGRSVLFIGKRTDALKAYHKIATKRGYDSLLVIYETNKGNPMLQKKVEQGAQIIWGIDKIAKQGLDSPRLDTLILQNPIKDIEQAVGRISRKHPDKKEPLVIYPVDNCFFIRGIFDSGMRLAKERDFALFRGYKYFDQILQIL
jgi:superfamily II DNA or RNA helicase